MANNARWHSEKVPPRVTGTPRHDSDSKSWLLFAGPGLRFPYSAGSCSGPDVIVCRRAHFRELGAQMSMSALGQKPTHALQKPVALAHVCFGPIADIASEMKLAAN